MRRLVLLAAVVAGVGFAAPAFASQPVPVGVYQKPDGSVCVAVSLQVPFCTPPLSFVQGPTVPQVPPVPVTVDHRPDGSICVTFSKQLPQCTPPTD